MKPVSKAGRVVLVQQLLAGTKKHFSDGNEALPVRGANRTIATVTQLLQDAVELRQAVISAQAVARARVAEEREGEPAVSAGVDEFVAFLRLTFAKQPEVLVDFGLEPVKERTPLTAEQKAVAVAKGQATRKARHTMGKVQRKAVTGSITAKLVVTDATPAAAAPRTP